MANNFYGATSLIGGGTGAADAINGNLLNDGDGLVVITATLTYAYKLDATSGAAESSPGIISPDNNAGTKRWILKAAYISPQVKWAKGADVASANALTLGADGNYFDITGTTAITSIGTLGVGIFVGLHFDGILTLTHNATDLILPGGANITTAAGDEAWFVEYASGDWRCVNYTRADGTVIVGGGGVATDPIWAAAGDLLQGTGNDAGEVLSIGAANLKAFVNAAGTKIEWANGTKIGTFSIDTATASGDQAITGVGFKPSNVLLLGGIHPTDEVFVGLDNGTLHYHMATRDGDAVNTWSIYDNASLRLLQSAGITYSGTITALGADGFTISWTKAGAKTGTASIYYLAFR